jgi:hypothetical protein
MNSEENSIESANSDRLTRQESIAWTLFGEDVPRAEVQYLCQVIITFIVIVTCLVNMSISNGHTETWVSFLGYSLGTLLPPPKLKQLTHPFKKLKKNKTNWNGSEQSQVI